MFLKDFFTLFLSKDASDILVPYFPNTPSFLLSFFIIIFVAAIVLFFSGLSNSLFYFLYKKYWQFRVWSRSLKVLSAYYGAAGKGIDITLELNKSIKNDKCSLPLSNDIGGEPCFGIQKFARIKYQFKGKVYTKDIKEGEQIILP